MMYGERNRERVTSEAFQKRVREIAEEGIAESLGEVEKWVSEEIEQSISKIVPALLGFERRWDEWKISYSNRDRSPIGASFSHKAAEVADKIVAEALKDWTPTKGMLQAIRSAYNEALEYQLREAARIRAARHADEWADEFIGNAFEELAVKPDDQVEALRERVEELERQLREKEEGEQ